MRALLCWVSSYFYILIMSVLKVHPHILDTNSSVVIKVDFSSWVFIFGPEYFSPRVHLIKSLWYILPVFTGRRQHSTPMSSCCSISNSRCMNRNLHVSTPSFRFDVMIFF